MRNLFLLLFVVLSTKADKPTDLIGDLPNTTFQTNFKQYSGYLLPKLHYWYFESQNNATTDPLVLFIAGGPLCSSIYAALEEIGPLKVYPAGDSLYENVFSWNKMSNLLVIDLPGVGFSPAGNNTNATDANIVGTLRTAVLNFLTNFRERIPNKLFIAGQGYASVFATKLANSLLQQPNFPGVKTNFGGLMIANGRLSQSVEYDSFFSYAYVHGYAGKDDWDNLQVACCKNQSSYDCSYSTTSQTNPACSNASAAAYKSWRSSLAMSTDIYQDCYTSPSSQANIQSSIDTYSSYPCSAPQAIQTYLAKKDVRDALHITGTDSFVTCASYAEQTFDLRSDLLSMLNNGNYTATNASILIYNGDVDSIYTFLSARKFASQIADSLNVNMIKDEPWNANYHRYVYNDTDGGLRTEFTNRLYVLTVRGGGYKAAINRPSQVLQIVRDHVNGFGFNNCLGAVNLKAQPLKQNYQYLSPATSRKQTDLVTYLPGITFRAGGWRQYSGFLNGGNHSSLHYWFVECQTQNVSAPIILWLGGGPGGSALRGLLHEHGPFKPNKDGQSLFENYFSWNKFANILYIESPVGVGYSYPGSDLSQLNDDETAQMNYNALIDFLASFPEYTGEFFISGESYAAVFVTTLAKKILDGVSSKDIHVNIKGISIGNGALSSKQQANSVIFQKYAYGLIGQTEYDNFASKCCNNTDPTTCDFYGMYLTVNGQGRYQAKTGADQTCVNLTMSYADISFFDYVRSDKNLYQDCYTNTKSSPNILPQNRKFNDYATMINLDSTDPYNGFPCWKDTATEKYLDKASVRKALNIPDDAPVWKTYNPLFAANYTQQYPELADLLTSIINHPVYKKEFMRVLIYNGDVDLVCNHLGDQWFVNSVADGLHLATTGKYSSWSFEMPGHREYGRATVGYSKKFSDRLTYVTLKGAGHNSVLDRPMPALQMMYNFINNQNTGTILTSANIDLTPKPLTAEYQNMPPCQATAAAPPSNFPPINQEKVAATQNYTAAALKDEIHNLPGLPYKPAFRQFSGYLTVPEHPLNHLFYWFTESQNDPANDPVVLWFNGGPGCSGLGGFFEELGPFHNNDDGGQTLYENVYAWNKKANVIFLEAPVGVGFSYTTDPAWVLNDDNTAMNNALAMKLFFEELFPQYAKNEFYITSESYGGVYVPTLARDLINMLENNTLSINFKGFAIGNGYLSHHDQSNSELTFQYGHGFTGTDDWNALKAICNVTTINPIYFDYNGQAKTSSCYLEANKLTTAYFSGTNTDPYDIYVDCYTFGASTPANISAARTRGELARQARMSRRRQAVSDKPFLNNNDGSWFGSTDPFLGLACYNDEQLAKYLNRKDVQDAIHGQIHQTVLKHSWSDCANLAYGEQPKYYDMHGVLNEIMDSDFYAANNMRIMLYNGDADTICQFLGDQWWAERLIASRNMTTLHERNPWYYQKTASDPKILAGFVKKFSENFVQMTVKGAGHMVPMDRPGPALQMLLNFLSNSDSYSTLQPVDVTRQTLFPDYQNSAPASCSRRDSDRVLSLPGVDLSQIPNNVQYSGLLKGSASSMLHYWLYDVAGATSNAPLVLWLNGGPGTSSLDGLFMENGLYRINRDGKTVTINPYAWDFAAMLYLESPVGVGYSYTTDGQTPGWSDNNTATEAYAALKDFFSIYPDFLNRPFFITGESYGGVYIPMLSKLIIDGMSTFSINFMGMAIGNGVLDKAVDTNSLPHAEYYRGGIPLTRYQKINSLCCSDIIDEMTCDYSKHISDFNSPTYGGNQSDPCYVELMNLAVDVLANSFDAYNLYEQCYELLSTGVTEGSPVGETWTGINYESSDANNAYWCWYKNALTNYLNMDEVRQSLNIPDGVQYWQEDAGIAAVYKQQTASTNDIISYILSTDYVSQGNFYTLIYHGDVDTMKNWLGGEWFTYHLFHEVLQLKQTSARAPWTYQNSVGGSTTLGGYTRSYAKNVDVMTVRGAGHEVPFDRPGQSYVMMKNWIAKATMIANTTVSTTTQLPTSNATVISSASVPISQSTSQMSSNSTSKSTTTQVPATTSQMSSNSTSKSTTTQVPATTSQISSNSTSTSTTTQVPATTPQSATSVSTFLAVVFTVFSLL